MNIVTNEMTGMFLLPLAQTMSLGVWDVVNGLGLVFVPFIYLYVRSFFDARAQGMDEGSPAVLAVKLVEKSFIGYIAVIAFILTPISGAFKVEHRQYSCLDNPSIMGNQLAGASNANADVLRALGVSQDTSPPLYFGLIHQVATGINEAATAQLSCQKGASSHDVTQALSRLIPTTEPVYHSINEFNQRCYRPAHNLATTAIAQGQKLRAPTNSKYNWSFRQPDFVATSGIIDTVYRGSHIVGQSNTAMFVADVPDTWFDISKRGDNVACATLADDLYQKIRSDLRDEDDHRDGIEAIQAFTSIFNPSSTPAEVEHDMVMQVFENAITKQTSQESLWKKGAKKTSVATGEMSMVEIASLGSSRINGGLDWVADVAGEGANGVMDAVTSTMVAVGGLVTTMVESAKSHAVALILPLIITVVQCIMLITLPILTVMSGYSFSFIYNWTLLYLSVSMAPFWMNVGVQIETLLLSAANYSDSLWAHAVNVAQANEMNMYLVGATASTFVYLTPVVWVMLVQIVGNIAASAFMNMVSGAAIVGQTGADLAMDATEETARQINAAVDKALKEKFGKPTFSVPDHENLAGNQSSGPGIGMAKSGLNDQKFWQNS